MAGTRRSLMIRFSIILLVLILPFNILGLGTALHAYHSQRNNLEMAVSSMLDSTGTLLKSRLKNSDADLYWLMNNNEYLYQMKSSANDSAYQLARHRLFQSVSERIRFSGTADAVFLYLPEFDDYLHVPGFDHATVASVPHRHLISEDAPIRSSWTLSEDSLELYRVMYDRSTPMIFGAAVNLENVLSSLRVGSSYQTMIFSCGAAAPAASSGRLTVSREILPGFFLSASVSTREIGMLTGSLTQILILFFLLYFSLIPILLFFVRKNVASPLKILNQAHRHLEQGESDYRIQAPVSTSEFQDAYESFNHMSSTLQTLQKEVLEKELQNKQLQIDYLQLQIRPHFLLNSFNVLYTLIQRGERESSQEMILFLSEYFRYLFRSGNELQPFSQERRLIEDYLRITRIYYPEAFQVTYMLDPTLDLLPVPPLLLHSFLENIIAHALVPDRTIHIVFSGEYEEGLAAFLISDDGAGIPPDAVQAINHAGDDAATKGENVGIRNSILRLKYYFGPQASVFCESEENVGTTFTIKVPCDLEQLISAENE